MEENEKAPPEKLVMDLTVEDAKSMSTWLLDKAQEAERKNTTVRIYQDQNNYTEVPGFAIWGSMWGKSGNVTPPVFVEDDQEL